MVREIHSVSQAEITVLLCRLGFESFGRPKRRMMNLKPPWAIYIVRPYLKNK
jgi:hypothetical protein